MSDNEKTGETKTDVNGMPEGDLKFLMSCLNNTNGGQINIDIKAVAEELGMTNHRSASNKLSTLKKKYNIPLSTAGGSTGTPTKADGGTTTPKKAAAPKTPKTPAEKKAKVTKPKAEKKTPVKKAPAKGKKAKEAVEAEAKEGGGEADVEMEDENAVKMSTPELEEKVFGKEDSADEDEA